MTAHVAADAAALGGRVPEPRLVRAAVLLGAAGQMGRSHGLLYLRQLRARLDDRGHVNLILEVGRGNVHRLGDPRQHIRFAEIAGERLLDDDPLEPGPGLDGGRDLAHHRDSGEIRGKDTNDVHRSDQVGDGVIRLGVTEAILPGQLGQRLGSLEGVDPRELGVSHRTQGPLVKSRDKTRTDHPDLQHWPILPGTCHSPL